ncbi:MAG: zf-HC2 domain-containing protein [Pyrinomonadaceae bacterium]|nr:zf-HC2 domain-containing protein [Pyrinomonadaceae bacterium]
MGSESSKSRGSCKREMIAAFYDGDLSPSEELIAESHIASCPSCANYLNSLKMVSSSLEIFLDEEPVKLPGEFSKRVTAAAESDMNGLRSGKERSRAVLVGAVLLFVAAVAVSVQAAGVGPEISALPAAVLALIGMLGHFIYAGASAVSVVFGAVCSKFLFGSSVAIILLFTILFVSVLIFSKHILRFHRS